jgi:hypothetical protein
MYSDGSIDEPKRDKLKELIFDEDPELLSYFCQPGINLKSIESRILNYSPHPEKTDGLSLFNNDNNDELSTDQCTPLLNNENIADLQQNSNYTLSSLFVLQPNKLFTE